MYRMLMAAAAVLLVALSSARAEFTLYLNNPNSGIAAYPGPYAEVDINLVSGNTAQVTVTGLNSGGYYYLLGSDSAIALNVNGTVGSATLDSWHRPDGTTTNAPTLAINDSKSADGFGAFKGVRLDAFDGAGSALDTFVFTITKQTGTWASDSDVVTPNGNGWPIAGHVYVYDNQNYNLPAVSTGFSANGPPNPIPAPSSLVLLSIGSGLIGLVGMKQMRRNKATAQA